MKYLLVVIFTMFSVIVEASTPVKIQSFGFKGGLTISNATGYVNAVHEALGAKNEYHYTTNYTGFVDFKIGGCERIFLRSEITYISKGFQYQQKVLSPDIIPGEESFQFTYLEFPVLLVFSMNLEKDLKPLIFAGPYAARLLEAWDEFEGFRDHYEDYQMNKWEYGVKFGAGIDLSSLIIEGSYSQAFTAPLVNSDIKNYMFNFTLGYYFSQ